MEKFALSKRSYRVLPRVPRKTFVDAAVEQLFQVNNRAFQRVETLYQAGLLLVNNRACLLVKQTLLVNNRVCLLRGEQ